MLPADHLQLFDNIANNIIAASGRVSGLRRRAQIRA
jgi:hypothetical protein